MEYSSLKALSIIVGSLNVIASVGSTTFLLFVLGLAYKDLDDSMWVVAVLILLVLLAWTCLSLLLIFGICQDNYHLITGWIAFQFAIIIIMILFTIACLIPPNIRYSVTYNLSTLELIFDLIGVGVFGLLLLPVYLFCQSIKSNRCR